MSFEFNNDKPIYLQIVEYLKQMIVSGKYLPKQKIPSVRELALFLEVNPNTVQKALQELEETKLIFTERTNGKYVTENVEIIENLKKELVNERVEKFFKDMEEIGIDNKQVFEIIKRKGE